MPMAHEPFDATHFDPPAPVAEVAICGCYGLGLMAPVVMLIDTGADTTLIPRRAVESLGIPILSDQSFTLIAFDGRESTAAGADLDLIFQRKLYRGRYVLVDDKRGVLGRDILNHVAMLIDGPNQSWSVRST